MHHLTDQPAQAPEHAAVDRPLIHDVMDHGRAMAQNNTLGASERLYSPGHASPIKDGFLEITPVNYGSSFNSGGIARPVENNARPVEAKPDPFKTTGDGLVQSANASIGKDLTVAPKGADAPHIPKKFGCAASVSNLLIKENVIGVKDFQVNVDGLEKMLVSQKGAERIDAAHLQKGDIVVGRGENDGSGGRHVGVVDVNDKGKLVALNNAGGHFKKDDLKARFLDKYQEVYGLRIQQ